MDVKDMAVEHFEGRVGEAFRVVLGDDRVYELRLAEVETSATAAPGRSFSLVFMGPSELLLPQQIYDLAHEELGTFAIFLVPIAREGDGYLYEAVFTRLEDVPPPTTD